MKRRDSIAQEVMHSAGRMSSHRSGALPITRGKYPAMWSSLLPEARAAMLHILSHILGLERPCHTSFSKRNQVHLICVPGSVYTHMIDKMSEISLTVFKRISEFNHLLHSCGRLEGL
jgi:hypothetical protein